MFSFHEKHSTSSGSFKVLAVLLCSFGLSALTRGAESSLTEQTTRALRTDVEFFRSQTLIRNVETRSRFLASAERKAEETQERPNFVVIVADDLGYSDIGCYGSEIATPHLDQLAANGLRFTQFYNTARCWPTRGALVTGYYPQQIRMDPPKGRLPTWARPLPQLLKTAGYRSYHSGKWHVQGAPQPCADGGFDRSYHLMDHNRHFHPQQHAENDQPLPAAPAGSGYYSTTAIADHAIRCLKEHAEKHRTEPFFSYVAFTAPHFPIQAFDADIARYRQIYRQGWDVIRQRRFARQQSMKLVNCTLSEIEPAIVAPSGKASDLEILGPGEIRQAVSWNALTEEQKEFQATKFAIHAAMIDRMDREIGRVIDQLRAMGELENTVILFLSDNGASAEVMVRGDGHDRSRPLGSAESFLCLGPGGSTVANTPFRRHKIWVHEGGISTPLIVHWPKGIRSRGQLRTDPGHVIDLAPTLIQLAGLKAPSVAGAPPWPGRSLVPVFDPTGVINREFLFFHHSNNRALRMGDWKLVSAADNSNRWELYNLSVDRSETTDLSSQYPERVRDMAARWQSLQDEFVRQSLK